jgi:hypothetical protein
MEGMARELTDPTLELLEQFTAAWLRGESPDPRQVLDQAPADERAELSSLIDRFLVGQPSREPTDESLAYVHAIATAAEQSATVTEAPLVQARNKVGKRRETVLRELRDALGLGPGDESKLRRYYHRLESGLLDTTQVNERVWTALEAILQWRGDPRHRQPLSATAGAFFRSADSGAAAPNMDVAARLGFQEEVAPLAWDEVDELFLGPRPPE